MTTKEREKTAREIIEQALDDLLPVVNNPHLFLPAYGIEAVETHSGLISSVRTLRLDLGKGHWITIHRGLPSADRTQPEGPEAA